MKLFSRLLWADYRIVVVVVVVVVVVCGGSALAHLLSGAHCRITVVPPNFSALLSIV